MTDSSSERIVEPIRDPKLVKMLSEIRELVQEIPDASSDRATYGWVLEEHNEYDRKAIAVFASAGLDPTNPTHRDMLLEFFIQAVPISGRRRWSEDENWLLLKDVYETSLGLRRQNLPSGKKSACEALALKNNRHPKNTKADAAEKGRYPGRHTAATLRKRTIMALEFFRQCLTSDRYRRYSTAAKMKELKGMVRYFDGIADS